ncbi:hypothetical protein F5Y12DRAFT_757543 [Xylaria sp. FL1777]|nr:hypothetical protein F5Y12DRAFT_757543 [Xylaria sp. FL1777]
MPRLPGTYLDINAPSTYLHHLGASTLATRPTSLANPNLHHHQSIRTRHLRACRNTLRDGRPPPLSTGFNYLDIYYHLDSPRHQHQLAHDIQFAVKFLPFSFAVCEHFKEDRENRRHQLLLSSTDNHLPPRYSCFSFLFPPSLLSLLVPVFSLSFSLSFFI